MFRSSLILILFVCFTNIATAQIQQKEGLIKTTISNEPGGREATWFRDSTIIYQVPMHYSESRNDTLLTEGVCIRNYTILNLRTMKAQDYLCFSDTAKPVLNYQVKDTDNLIHYFLRTSHPYDKFVDSLQPLPDTSLDGNSFKRLYFDIAGEAWKYRIVYYQVKTSEENIFYLTKAVDKKYPGYKVVYTEYNNLINGYRSLHKMIIVREKLTPSEQKIFDKWESNLVTSKLPVITYKEAQSKIFELAD